MKCRLNATDLLLRDMARAKILRVNIVGDDLVWEEAELPEGLVPAAIPSYNIIPEVSVRGESYICYRKGKLFIYEPYKIPIILADIEYYGVNSKNTPIVSINGVRCSGYGNISQKLFGYYRKDIKQLLEPYLVEPDYTVVDMEAFYLIKVNKRFGKQQPVIGYKGLVFNSIKAMKDKFPDLDEKKVLGKIGYKAQVEDKEPRHKELINKFDINKVGDTFELTYNDEQVYLTSQKAVMEFIKSNGETISRDTAKKIFEDI